MASGSSSIRSNPGGHIRCARNRRRRLAPGRARLCSDLARDLARLQGGAGEIVGGEDLAALDQRGDLVLVEGGGFDQGTLPAPF
jgi:hypothetical protein